MLVIMQKKKIYKYIIFNRLICPPLHQHRSWVIKKKLDFNSMKKGIKYFLGSHNYSSMRASSCSAKNPERTITNAQIKKKTRGTIKYTYKQTNTDPDTEPKTT